MAGARCRRSRTRVAAAEAKVSKVTVHNHFSSKEELFTEVVSDTPEQALGASMHIMRERLRETGDIREVLPATAHGWSWVPPLRLLSPGASRLVTSAMASAERYSTWYGTSSPTGSSRSAAAGRLRRGAGPGPGPTGR
ncbi:TetR family transcriptional regulator [Streptomyces sp. NPDC020096]